MLTKTQATELERLEEIVPYIENLIRDKIECEFAYIKLSDCPYLQKNLDELKKRRRELIAIM